MVTLPSETGCQGLAERKQEELSKWAVLPQALCQQTSLPSRAAALRILECEAGRSWGGGRTLGEEHFPSALYEVPIMAQILQVVSDDPNKLVCTELEPWVGREASNLAWAGAPCSLKSYRG